MQDKTPAISAKVLMIKLKKRNILYYHFLADMQQAVAVAVAHFDSPFTSSSVLHYN